MWHIVNKCQLFGWLFFITIGNKILHLTNCDNNDNEQRDSKEDECGAVMDLTAVNNTEKMCCDQWKIFLMFRFMGKHLESIYIKMVCRSKDYFLKNNNYHFTTYKGIIIYWKVVYLLKGCALLSTKQFIHSNFVMQPLPRVRTMLPSYFRWGNWGLGRGNDLPNPEKVEPV